jgi:hypothetical protein
MVWGPEATPEGQFARVLEKELACDHDDRASSHGATLQDDRPESEHLLLAAPPRNIVANLDGGNAFGAIETCTLAAP